MEMFTPGCAVPVGSLSGGCHLPGERVLPAGGLHILEAGSRLLCSSPLPLRVINHTSLLKSSRILIETINIWCVHLNTIFGRRLDTGSPEMWV